MDNHALERIDVLTGCENLLAFLEKLSAYLKETPSKLPFSLLLLRPFSCACYRIG